VESALYVFEALLLVEELEQWFSTWAKSPPRGDFVIYEIWGASSVSRGRFLQVKTYSDVELIPKNQYLLLGIKAIDARSTPWLVTKLI